MTMESVNSTDLDEKGDKPFEPDHPMLMDGRVIPGDTAFMVRCQVEEYLQLGILPQTIENMANNPRYGGLYASRRVLGDEVFLRILADTVQRIGVHAASFQESETT
jgi:hypothetical protein